MHLPLNFVNYLGPGLGLGTIVIVLIVLFIVLISFFLIAWTPIKKLLRKAKSKPEKGGAVIKRNWVKYLVVTVLALAFLCGFSYCVHLVDIGSKSLGPLTEPIRSFATFPEVIHEALTSTEIRNIPPDYVRVEPDFVELNRLDYDLYGVNSFIEPDKSLYELRLFNLRNDSIIYSWTIHKDSVNFFSTFLDFDRCAPMAPLIFDDLSVVTFLNRSKNMVRIDKDSKIKWENNSNVFHHTLNLNSSGDIWVCTSVKRGIKTAGSESILDYDEDCLTLIDFETGETKFKKGITSIFLENGMSHVVFGNTNKVLESGNDPIHLNDIEPCLSDGAYWKKDDLFISLRNRSMILLYRPSTNQVIRSIQGPFFSQHDVDILSDSTIALFNNNYCGLGTGPAQEGHAEGDYISVDTLGHSQVLIYHMDDSSFVSHADIQFSKENLFTKTQGLYTFISNGDLFVESQNTGKLYILNEDEMIWRKGFHTYVDGMVERPHWVRIYENIDFTGL